MRIAVLVTAFKNEDQLNRLIHHLSKDFDIYVHIDKRSSFYLKESENVRIFKKYKSYWGSYNTILAMLFLLIEASKKDYDRYIQITGQDLPIKSNKYIAEHFEKNRNVEFIEYFKLPHEKWRKHGGMDRILRYWGTEPSRLTGPHKWLAFILKAIIAVIYKSPFAFLFRRRIEYQFYGGSNYMDLTGHCVTRIIKYLDNNPAYFKRFRYTLIPEEIFFHTIILNLELETVINDKNYRYIDWDTGPDHPRTLTINDYKKIMDSENLFARKFDENIDNEVIMKIYQNLL